MIMISGITRWRCEHVAGGSDPQIAAAIEELLNNAAGRGLGVSQVAISYSDGGAALVVWLETTWTRS